ncbi:MAG: cell cycle RNA binding protein whi3 [Claussenomyces sp. TS43310]|nr:MAG: cell cycle RNA binding protein whi3 [Claussenomyces sp. TS43310]
MDAPAFVPQGQPFRAPHTMQQQHPLSMSTLTPFDREVMLSSSKSMANGPAGSPASSVIIRRLPMKTTLETLRSMVVFSGEFIEAEVLDNSEDPGFRSAVLRFASPAGAQEAKAMLNGKLNVANDAQMIVEMVQGSPTMSRRYPLDSNAGSMPNGGQASSSSSAASSAGPTPRQSSRFNGTFQSRERISPTNNGGHASNELPNPDSSTHYQSLFSPQSPIGNHLTERTRISGKTLINNDSVDDDETGELLKDPVAYAENGPSSFQTRRATNPPLPIQRMAGLSLNTDLNGGPVSMNGAYAGPSSIGSVQPTPTALSPTLLSNAGPSAPYQLGSQHFARHNFPPVNPADQNPPCNTLYVGNLPIDTSEDELKAMFSKQRGYKRLCFRTKQNGPMCFVEFEDVSFATKALHELYGHPLHNSIKGGIRLSFSKNPLGVRSGQGPGVPGPPVPNAGMSGLAGVVNGGAGATFSTANGPPPGLAAPPGLGPSRIQYGAAAPNHIGGNGAQHGTGVFVGQSSGWHGTAGYLGSMSNGTQSPMINGANPNFPPAYMMGR